MAITPVAGVTHQAVLKYGPPGSPSYVGLMLPGRDLSNFTIEPYTPFAPKSAEGYAAIRDFSIASVWELGNDWSGGTGHLVEGRVEANTYAYSYGGGTQTGGTTLYTAQKGRILPAPKLTQVSDIRFDLIQFITFGGRIYALSNDALGKIYQFAADGLSVPTTPVETLSAAGKQLWTDGTTLYATQGSAFPVRKTTNGTVWSNHTFNADYVEMRTGGVLCYVTGATFTPAGTEGYAAATIGWAGTNATSMVVLEDAVLIGKPEGLYKWIQGRVEELFAVPWAQDTSNFSKVVVHNNLIYFNVKNKLYYTDMKNVVEIIPKDVGGFKAIHALASSHGPLMIGAKITPQPAAPFPSGPRSVTTPATDIVDDASAGTVAWVSPGNAGVSDNAYATVTLPNPNDSSHYLKATNFGFAVPASASITGVKVEFEKSSPAGVPIIDSLIKLVKGGVIGGNGKVISLNWPTTDTYSAYGHSADLWGLSLTPADVNASNFGVVIQARNNGTGSVTGQIDHVRITVYYSYTSGDKNYIFMFNGPDDPGLNPLFSDVTAATPILAIHVSTAPDAAAARVYFDINLNPIDTAYIDLDLNFLPKTYNISGATYLYLTEFSAGFQSIKKWFYEVVLNVINPSSTTFATVYYSIDGADFVQIQDEAGNPVEFTLNQRGVGGYFPLDTTGTYVQLKIALRTTVTTGPSGISAVTIRGEVMVKPRYQIQFPADASQMVLPLQGPAEDGNAIKAAILTASQQGYPPKLQDYKGNWHLVLFRPPSPFEAVRDFAAPDAGRLLTAYPIIQMVLVEIDALASGGALNAWAPG